LKIKELEEKVKENQRIKVILENEKVLWRNKAKNLERSSVINRPELLSQYNKKFNSPTKKELNQSNLIQRKTKTEVLTKINYPIEPDNKFELKSEELLSNEDEINYYNNYNKYINYNIPSDSKINFDNENINTENYNKSLKSESPKKVVVEKVEDFYKISSKENNSYEDEEEEEEEELNYKDEESKIRINIKKIKNKNVIVQDINSDVENLSQRYLLLYNII
jgi:hypothetical protein